MPKYKSFDEPTKEEWYAIVSCGKKFNPGDIVEYGGELWKILDLRYEDDRYTPTEYIYNIENLKTKEAAVGSSQFMCPAGTFQDY